MCACHVLNSRNVHFLIHRPCNLEAKSSRILLNYNIFFKHTRNVMFQQFSVDNNILYSARYDLSTVKKVFCSLDHRPMGCFLLVNANETSIARRQKALAHSLARSLGSCRRSTHGVFFWLMPLTGA